MLFKTLLFCAAAAAELLPGIGEASEASMTKRQNENETDVDIPLHWGIIALPNVDVLDIFGPLDLLYFVAGNRQLKVTIITPTEESILINPPMGNRFNSTFEPEIVGRASFADDIPDLDLLLVPGGSAARDASLTTVDDYIVKMLPQLKHFVTICTGALFAARAGVFEGRRVTTNKSAWELVTAQGNNVTWVAPARWVRDGNFWTSSGVSAGIDLTFAMVKEFYGQELHDRIMMFTEIEPRAHDDDPWTDRLGIPHSGQETEGNKCNKRIQNLNTLNN